MPVIKSAKKQMRQSLKRRERNYPVRSELKTLVKKELGLIKDGKLEEALKFLPSVYSMIDTACKKNIIHSSNAARKKSRVARALNALQSGGKKVAEKVAGQPVKDAAVPVAAAEPAAAKPEEKAEK